MAIIDANIIYENPNGLAKVWLKHKCHKPLEGGWRIGKTKGHYPISKISPWHDEGCLLLVLLGYANLEVPSVPITYHVALIARQFI